MQTHEDYRKGISKLALADLYYEEDRWEAYAEKARTPEQAAVCRRRAEIVREAIQRIYDEGRCAGESVFGCEVVVKNGALAIKTSRPKPEYG